MDQVLISGAAAHNKSLLRTFRPFLLPQKQASPQMPLNSGVPLQTAPSAIGRWERILFNP